MGRDAERTESCTAITRHFQWPLSEVGAVLLKGNEIGCFIPFSELAKSLSLQKVLAPNHIYLSFYLFQNNFIHSSVSLPPCSCIYFISIFCLPNKIFQFL